MTVLLETERRQDVASVAASLTGVTHRYGKTVALDNVTLAIPAGRMTGLIGPDGVGKSTLLGLIAGVRKIQTGDVKALGGDLRDAAFRQGCFARIAYMPQGLGRNLYPTLSVFENLDFIGRLFGQGEAERKARIDDLTRSTGLDPFLARPAGKLSGGMKQKLSLCCSLIHDPDLLDPRRADDRRRPALAAAVLGADRPHPCAPAADERGGRDGLHGRGGAVRLARGHGRGPCDRDGLAGGDQGPHRRQRPRVGVHRRFCPKKSARVTRRSRFRR